MTANEDPQWNVPGWDWDKNDYSWLSSESGIYRDGVSIFFIHGGRIRHQAHIKYGSYSIEEFCGLIRDLAKGLDDPRVEWMEDTGGGEADLWVEGTRAPGAEDLDRLRDARSRKERDDRVALRSIRERHPEWFTGFADTQKGERE